MADIQDKRELRMPPSNYANTVSRLPAPVKKPLDEQATDQPAQEMRDQMEKKGKGKGKGKGKK